MQKDMPDLLEVKVAVHPIKDGAAQYKGERDLDDIARYLFLFHILCKDTNNLMKRERKKKENELTLVNCVDGHQKKVVFTFISLKSHGAFQKSSYLCIVKRIKKIGRKAEG